MEREKVAGKVAGLRDYAYLCTVKHQVWLSGQNPERAGLHRHRPVLKPPREGGFYLSTHFLNEFLDEIPVFDGHTLDEVQLITLENDDFDGRWVDVEIVHQVFRQNTWIVVCGQVEDDLIGLSDGLQEAVAHGCLAGNGLQVVDTKSSFSLQNKVGSAYAFRVGQDEPENGGRCAVFIEFLASRNMA